MTRRTGVRLYVLELECLQTFYRGAREAGHDAPHGDTPSAVVLS